tara:strand:- start:39 stop:302 length:264 start_codon:yes stop_codon:yes gene_type:complete
MTILNKKDLNRYRYGNSSIILFSVGCLLNTKNGDTFPMLENNTADFDDRMNIMEMDADRFSSQEWFDALSYDEYVVVKNTIKYLGGK